MEEDALLDQFSMTFDLLPQPKNDDALLEEFSMSFDLSPLVKEEKEDMSKEGEQQYKTTKKEKYTKAKANYRNADINKKKTQKVVGVYVCKICDKDLCHRKGLYDHIRMRHKMKWIEYASEQGLDIKRERKVKKKRKKEERKFYIKSEEKEVDHQNTSPHEEKNTEQKQKRKVKKRKFKYQDISDGLGKKKANKLEDENVNEIERSCELNHDMKKDIVTLDNNENKTGGLKKKQRRWKKGIEGVYICNICKEDLGNRFNIRNHMKKKHNTVWKPERKNPSKSLKREKETADLKNNAGLSIDQTKTEKTNVKRKNKHKKMKREFQESLHLKIDKSFKKGEAKEENALVNEKRKKSVPRKLSTTRKWKKGKVGVYICTVCDKDNGNKPNLQYHMRINHKEIWQQKREKRMKDPKWKKGVEGFFICEFCEKDCGNKPNFHVHLKRKHNTEWQEIKMKNIIMEKKKIEEKENQLNTCNVSAVNVPREDTKEIMNLPDNSEPNEEGGRLKLLVLNSGPISPHQKPLMRKREVTDKKRENEDPEKSSLLRYSLQDKRKPEVVPCYACLACYENNCVNCMWCSAKKNGKRTKRCLTKKCLNPLPRDSNKENVPLTLMEGQPFAFGPIKITPLRRNPPSAKTDNFWINQQGIDENKFNSPAMEKTGGGSFFALNVQPNKDESFNLEETDIISSPQTYLSNSTQVDPQSQDKERLTEYSFNAIELNDFTDIEGTEISQVSESSLALTEDTFHSQDQLIEDPAHAVPYTNKQDGDSNNQFSAKESFHVLNIGDSLGQDSVTDNEEIDHACQSEKLLAEDANQPSLVSLNDSPGTYTLCRAEDGTLYVVKS